MLDLPPTHEKTDDEIAIISLEDGVKGFLNSEVIVTALVVVSICRTYQMCQKYMMTNYHYF